MNREDVINLAEEALSIRMEDKVWTMSTTHLEHFANAIVNNQRAKVAFWMISQGYATGHGDTIEDLLKELEWQIRESEREACAKVPVTLVEEGMAEHMPEGDELILARKNLALAVVIAEVIRARGEQ